jgi:uncharacterized SAM-binding protein YcdF (DUF218 family)
MRPEQGWRRWLVVRKETVRTTWTLRLALLVLVVVLVPATRDVWAPWVGWSLVCRDETGPAEAILIENFDRNYLLFERAERLLRAGAARRVLVPVPMWRDTGNPNAVEQGIAEVMGRIARLPTFELLPIREIEPISLEAAYQIRDALRREGLQSVLVVAPGFRSRRSALVYERVLGAAGVTVRCLPVFGTKTPENWTASWHGIQEVTEQLLKLQFYRFYVLPFGARGR